MKLHSFCTFIIFFLLPATLFSQISIEDKTQVFDLPKQDFDQFILDINADNWLDGPDYITKKPTSTGVDLYLIYAFPFGKSNFSIAPGLGMSSYNIHSNVKSWDVDSSGNFYNLIPDSVNYKKNKISALYLEIPVEIRLSTKENKKGKKFMIIAGFKVGYLVKSLRKYKDKDIKFKYYDIKNLNPLRYGIVGRVGYNKLFLSAFYSLSTLFKANEAPAITPFSIGLSLFIL